MKEILLCNCPNGIVADNVISMLDVNGIVFRQHDETMDQRVGSYGPSPGIAIYVLEKDYTKARELVEPVINDPIENIKPFCPKCGNEDTVPIKQAKYVPLLLILSIVFFIAPCVYLFNADTWGIKSVVMDVLSVAMLLASLIMMILCKYKNVNYQCNGCGKKFNHI